MSKLPSQTLRRAQLSSPCTSTCAQQTQIRHASLLKRPHRPYQFTQLVILSDGSTYTQRTTSPQPIFRTTKDTRNHPLWQPSMTSLRNVEEDEAGRLRSFRLRFGRGWDAETPSSESPESGSEGEEVESLMDLISDAGGGGAVSLADKAEDGGAKKGEEVEMITVRKDGVLVKVPALSRGERRGKS